MTDPFEAIRAHVEKHAGKERATFTVAGVKALLNAVDDLDRRLNEEQMQTANSGEIINDLKAERDEWQRRAERAENALPGPAETQAHANYVEGLRARAEAAMVDGWQPTHQHLKRRSLYRFVGAAKLQTSVPLSDMDAMVVYQAEDGSFWVRPDVEFYDGRFLLLAGED